MVPKNTHLSFLQQVWHYFRGKVYSIQIVVLKILAIVSVFSLFALRLAPVQTDISDDVVSAFKDGDAVQLSKFFNSTIEVTLLEEESVFSKMQAEQVLRDFFKRNKVKSFQLLHKSNTTRNASYAIGTLYTGKGNYRTYYSINRLASNSYIKELRIEKY